MPKRLSALLPAAALLLVAAAMLRPAAAQAADPSSAPQAATTPAAPPAAAVPPGLLGAWGDDSSCTADVAIFRADGTVSLPGAPPDAPVTRFTVDGPSITFTQGSRRGTFAFGLTDSAVAWSNGASLVLKSRCANQAAFLGGSAPAPSPSTAAAGAAAAAESQGSLFDRVRALAAAPLVFGGLPIKVLRVTATRAAAHPATGPIYDAITAEPDPAATGPGATLLYRIFPTVAAAAAYATPAPERATSFLRDERAPGAHFGLASATDNGPPGHPAPPVAIACIRLHLLATEKLRIACFAHMPGSRLVAGGAQSFPLPPGTAATDLGAKADLAEVLDLTSLAIDQLRTLTAQN
ncbi:hypothetical protein [Acidisoma sp. C75]